MGLDGLRGDVIPLIAQACHCKLKYLLAKNMIQFSLLSPRDPNREKLFEDRSLMAMISILF